MNRKTLLWIIAAFIAGGALAARQSLLNTPGRPAPDQTSPIAKKEKPAAVPQPKERDVALILIAQMPKDGKAKDIGCGNTTQPMISKSTFTGDPVKNALEMLFTLKHAGYENGKLYNPLYQSKLKVQSVTTTNNQVTAHLTGNLTLGGECDIPRIRAQLIGTIKAASSAENVSVFINGKSLSDALSLK